MTHLNGACLSVQLLFLNFFSCLGLNPGPPTFQAGFTEPLSPAPWMLLFSAK